MSNNIHYRMWDEITNPFPNFNGATVEVWEWISNFIPHCIEFMITYPCWPRAAPSHSPGMSTLPWQRHNFRVRSVHMIFGGYALWQIASVWKHRRGQKVVLVTRSRIYRVTSLASKVFYVPGIFETTNITEPLGGYTHFRTVTGRRGKLDQATEFLIR